MFDEAKISALWETKRLYDMELAVLAKDWLYNIPKEIDIEGTKISLQ